MPGDYPHIESPFEINGSELRNRIVRTAHVTGYADGGVTERLIAYHETRARGGVALSIIEYAAVHPTCPTEIQAYLPDVVDGWARLADRVHAHGMKVFEQLWHGGGQGPGYRFPVRGLAPRQTPDWAPSAIPGPQGTVTIAMTQGMIDEIVDAFATAAARCREAGLDGVEVHGGHGYLIGEFLSPLMNQRGDGYGGSLENRTRFATEVLRAIRQRVGEDYPLGIRLSAGEDLPGGIEVDETIETAVRLEKAGLVDFVDVSYGCARRAAAYVGAAHAPHGYMLPAAEPVARALTVPTMVTGRFTSLAEAEDVVARGVADLVSMVRALLADPELVGKSLDGREGEVRPCIGCNQGCIGARVTSGVIGCTVNPEAGRETAEPAGRPGASRSVLVIGGGPAGMEAARTAAMRGHKVTLCEQAEQLGGLVNTAREAPNYQDFGRIADFLTREMARLGVDVRLKTAVDAALVRSLQPDVVVVATGALARRDGILRTTCRPPTNADAKHVVSVTDVLDGARFLSGHVVVFDDLGTYPAVGAAEFLVAAGLKVTYLTSQPAFAPGLALSFQSEPALERLMGSGRFSYRTRTLLLGVNEDHVVTRPVEQDRHETLAADFVVLHTGFEPQRSLYEELAADGWTVHVTGDAIACEGLQRAITSGRQVASEI
jgi:2,4-dienoyl-CoA reductase-like NADH-dependent reductase (Old Yellow Enzyme family)/NADPH-dependent 2,4-dienoyl-CoA reductase/sulfur reductase-like enzyme